MKTDDYKGLKRINCKLCNGNFASLQSHKIHTDPSKFHLEANLKRHISSVHEKLRKFNCKLCDGNLSASHGLKQHLERVHEKLKKSTL